MRKDRGAISVFVLIAMLFFLAFIMVSYNTVQEKGKTQQETTQVLKGVYDTGEDINAVYSQKYSGAITDLNTVTKTDEQANVAATANYIAIDGVIYKRDV